jgi:hypothetical protein
MAPCSGAAEYMLLLHLHDCQCEHSAAVRMLQSAEAILLREGYTTVRELIQVLSCQYLQLHLQKAWRVMWLIGLLASISFILLLLYYAQSPSVPQ